MATPALTLDSVWVLPTKEVSRTDREEAARAPHSRAERKLAWSAGW